MRGLPLLLPFTISVLFVGLGDTRSIKDGASFVVEVDSDEYFPDRKVGVNNTCIDDGNTNGILNGNEIYNNTKDIVNKNGVNRFNHNSEDHSFRDIKYASIWKGNVSENVEGRRNKEYIIYEGFASGIKNKNEVNQSCQNNKDRFGVKVYIEYQRLMVEDNNNSMILFVQIDTDDAGMKYTIQLCRTCDTPRATVIGKGTETATATATPGATAEATAKAADTSTATATATATGSARAITTATASGKGRATASASATGASKANAAAIATTQDRGAGTATATATATDAASATATATAAARATSQATATATATATGSDSKTDVAEDYEPNKLAVVEEETKSITLTKPLFTTRIYLPLYITSL